MLGSGRAACRGKDYQKPDYGYPYDPGDGREALDAPDNVLRVLRGGAFHDYRGDVRCAFRLRFDPNLRYYDLGFRVVLLPGTLCTLNCLALWVCRGVVSSPGGRPSMAGGPCPYGCGCGPGGVFNSYG